MQYRLRQILTIDFQCNEGTNTSTTMSFFTTFIKLLFVSDIPLNSCENDLYIFLTMPNWGIKKYCKKKISFTNVCDVFYAFEDRFRIFRKTAALLHIV